MILRDFLYLDRALVRTFLAQAEGGEYDEVTQRERTAGKGGVGLRAGVSTIGASAEKSKESAQESETVIKQVGASEFDRLYSALEDESLPILDEVSEISELKDLKRKQFIEIDARLAIAGFQQLMNMFATFGSSLGVMEQFGATVDRETVAGIQALAALDDATKPLPIIASVPGAAGLKVALELDRTFVMTDSWDADASVLLKIQRFIRGSERYLVGDPFGGLLKLMPEEERKKFAEGMKSGDMAKLGIGDVEVGEPAIIGTAVAIYR